MDQYERLIDAPVSFDAATRSLGRSTPQTGLDRLAMLERAKCHLRLSDLYRLSEQDDASEQQTILADQLLNTLRKTSPPQSRWRNLIRLEQVNVAIGQILLGRLAVDQPNARSHRDWLTAYLTAAEVTSADRPNDHDEAFLCRVLSAAARMDLAIHRGLDSVEGTMSLRDAVQRSSELVRRRGRPSDQQLSETVQTQWATWLEQSGRPDEAIEAWTRLIDDLHRWQSSREPRPDKLQSLAHARLRRAATLAMDRRATDRQPQAASQLSAKEDLRLAIKELDAAWQMSDADGFYRSNMAAAQNDLAQLLQDGDPSQRQEADRWYVRSLALYQSLLQDDPGADNIRRVAQTRSRLAGLRAQSGQADASEQCRGAILAYQILADHGELTAGDLSDWNRVVQLAASLPVDVQRSTTLETAEKTILEHRRDQSTAP